MLCCNRTDNYANAEVCRTTNMLFQTELKSQERGIHVSGESECRAKHWIRSALPAFDCDISAMGCFSRRSDEMVSYVHSLILG